MEPKKQLNPNNQPVVCLDVRADELSILALLHDELLCADALSKDAAMSALYNPSRLTTNQ